MAVVALLAASCASPSVRTAAFRERPDAIGPGDLRGPFSGRVLEQASGKPIAGALVYATWTFQSGYGTNRPSGFEAYQTNTDADGYYEVPALTSLPEGGGIRLSDFFLVVYKRGFVAYRSDRRFVDMGPRRDFSQFSNRIELPRWRDDFSHVSHMRYIGGGALTALTAWEAEEAAIELASAGKVGDRIDKALLPKQRGAYLVAAQLLTGDDVKKVTQFADDFESGPLGDEPDTTTYSSQHLKALNRPENYDVALRLWRLEPDKAGAHYKSLSDSLPSAESHDEIADRSLRATEGPIFGIAFLDAKRGVVALLTCGQGQCSSADVAAELAKNVFRRIQGLWPL